jgi:hypothetical protein
MLYTIYENIGVMLRDAEYAKCQKDDLRFQY